MLPAGYVATGGQHQAARNGVTAIVADLAAADLSAGVGFGSALLSGRRRVFPVPCSGSWYLSLELPAGSDGHRHRIRRGGFPTRKAAAKALARLRMPTDPAGLVTTGDWLDRWLGERRGPRESTIRGYAAHVRLYLKPCLGRILLADLSAQHVQAMFTAIARQHEAEGRRAGRQVPRQRLRVHLP